jgi:hypothetical protein
MFDLLAALLTLDALLAAALLSIATHTVVVKLRALLTRCRNRRWARSLRSARPVTAGTRRQGGTPTTPGAAAKSAAVSGVSNPQRRRVHP